MSKQKLTIIDKVNKFFNTHVEFFKRSGSKQRKSKGDDNKISLPLLVITYIIISLSAINSKRHTPESVVKPQALGDHTENYLEKEKNFWLTYLKENPKYIDGWLELTKIEYEMGNVGKAIRSLEKAKNINPNLLKVKNTEMELGL